MKTSPRTTPRLALSKAEAADTLGISPESFDAWVAPEIRMVYRGRRRLVPVREIEHWLERNAEPAGAR